MFSDRFIQGSNFELEKMRLTAEMVAEIKKIQDVVRVGLPWGSPESNLDWLFVFSSHLGYSEYKVKLENFLCETDEKEKVYIFYRFFLTVQLKS